MVVPIVLVSVVVTIVIVVVMKRGKKKTMKEKKEELPPSAINTVELNVYVQTFNKGCFKLALTALPLQVLQFLP